MLKEIIKRIRLTLDDQRRLIRSLFVNPKFWLILGMDVFLIVLAIYLSYIIRYEYTPHGADFGQLLKLIPLLITVKISCFYIFGLYRGMWRYTSTTDLFNVLKASLFSVFIIVTWLLYLNRFEGLSRSVFIIDTLFTFLFITGDRVVIRYLYKSSSGNKWLFPTSRSNQALIRLLLIGAGDAAEKVIRQINDNHALNYQIVGLVDDDPLKIGRKIHNIPILGKIEDLHEHARRIHACELLIAMSSIKSHEMKRIVAICQESGIPFKILPGIGELIDGKISVNDIRDIDYRDLLGREEIKLDQERIGKYLTNKVILITGAGGSIGSELCRQIIRFNPKLLILFDASEENLYNIQMELTHEKNFSGIVTILGKVQDLALVNLIFKRYIPSVIFHAAAYKHVPLIEDNPWQAVENNIYGSQVIMEAAIVYEVDRFVLVSTDKAVRPTNVMGASKRVTELLMHAYSNPHWNGYLSQRWKDLTIENKKTMSSPNPSHNTKFIAVRFGNVLGSSGSVIPLFKKQIAAGGPVTVTHPEITRYFMSIDEAAQLIIQAGSMGEGSAQIFILKMGEPIKIAQMAYDLIKMAGKEPEADIEICFTGLREGEKLYEELITQGEGIVNTEHEKIMVLMSDNVTTIDRLEVLLRKVYKSSELLDKKGIREDLRRFLPEYIPKSYS